MAIDTQTETTNILTEAEPTLIEMSSGAIAQLQTLMAQQDNPDLALRVFVYPGGCSGMSYGMAFEEEFAEDDMIFTQSGMRLVVDENSAHYLKGAQIDFEDSLMGGGFRIFNPNAVRSCGCGHSFDTGEDASNARACGCH
ncbi:MAG TPA: iron-sulfur cluster insertion protein ErpA [Chloroflexia bacterium]|nr:iron-sulfur cluster insertion protein ErpA [Chloroflexia bacterium]